MQAVSKEEKSVHKKEWKRVGLGPTGEDTFMGKNRTRDRTGQGIFPRGLRCCKQQQSACIIIPCVKSNVYNDPMY